MSNILLKKLSGGTGTSSSRNKYSFVGSDGSGSDGDANRVFTIISTDAISIVEVFLDGVLLNETIQYTVNNTLRTITILLNVFDGQSMVAFYNV